MKTAVAIAGEDPDCLMRIVGGRVRARDLPGALEIVAQLEEGLQRYAQWGIAQVQKEQGRPTEAQLTASAITPGRAKASALLELANHHIKVGAKSIAIGLLQEAATAAAATVNDLARADVLWHIAAAMAEAGETFTALDTAKAIEKEPHRRLAIHDIVKAQASQGDVKGAFNNALLLKRDHDAGGDGAGSYETAVADVLQAAVGSMHDFVLRHALHSAPARRKGAVQSQAMTPSTSLGLSMADTAEMEFRSDFTVALAKVIRTGRLTHAEIAKDAGTSRTGVTAIANGNTHGVSTDVLIRVLAATGYRAEVRVKQSAA